MIKYIVVTLSLSFSIYALAQDQNNLVPNSSFESIEGKFKKLKQISAAKNENNVVNNANSAMK